MFGNNLPVCPFLSLRCYFIYLLHPTPSLTSSGWCASFILPHKPFQVLHIGWFYIKVYENTFRKQMVVGRLKESSHLFWDQKTLPWRRQHWRWDLQEWLGYEATVKGIKWTASVFMLPGLTSQCRCPLHISGCHSWQARKKTN